jgi:hypothetical protein
MSSIQPGTGYTFSASPRGTTINIDPPFLAWDSQDTFSTEDVLHPYKVINANSGTFNVVPGMVNNLPTLVDGTQGISPQWLTDNPRPDVTWNWDATTNKSYVYLAVGKNSTTQAFPNPVSTLSTYPGVGSWDHLVTDTDDFGYIMLAEATIDPTTSRVVVSQYVTGSLWADRLKTGTDTARYYYARV